MSRSSICRRPLFLLCAVFFLSSLFFARVNGMTIILTSLASALALAGCGVLFVCKRSTVRIVPVLICAAVILSGVFTYFTVTSKIRNAGSLDGATADGRVTVLSVEYTSEYLSAYTVRLDGLDGYSGKISLSLEDRSLSRGDVLDGKFKLSVPAKDDKSEYYKSGIFLLAEAEEVSFVESRSKFSVSGFFDELNEKLCRVLKGNGDQGELATAVLLGDRDGLDTAVKRDFSRLGIYHLLALSGLHLSVLVSALGKALDKTRLKHLTRSSITATAILLYMALTGFSVSVVRAGVMHVISIAAGCLNRESDSLTSLSAAAVLILLTDPVAVFDAGLLLSVLAAYGCISLASLQGNRPRPPKNLILRAVRYAIDISVLTVFVSLITLPVVWLTFGEISIISPLVNVLFIPAVTLLLMLSAISLLLGGIPVLSDVTLTLLYFAESAIVKCASAISRLEGITVTLRHTGCGVFIVLLFLTLIPLALVKAKARKYLLLSACVCALGIVTTSVVGHITWSNSCDVQYTVSGISDAVMLRDGDSYTVIDVSSGTRSMAYRITKAVKGNRGCEIERLILTHYDTGHISAVPYMADLMIIRNVLLPSPETDDERDVCERITASLKDRHVPVTVYDKMSDSTYSDGGLYINVLPAYYYEASDHPIVTLSFTLDGRSYAYGGSALRYADPSFITAAEAADTIIIGAHPPKGDGMFFPYITGTALIPQKILTDELRLALADAKIITVSEKEIYTVSDCTPK